MRLKHVFVKEKREEIMEIVRFKLRGKKGLELSCLKIVPEEVKGVMHILHGMGEHKERYVHFAKFMAKNSYAVYVHDHRKHGKSVVDPLEVGIFTKEDTWDDVIDDVNFVNRQIKKDFPKLPIIILGHSMGSIIARKYISKYNNSTTIGIIMGTLPPMSLGKVIAPLMLANVLSLFNRKNKRSEFLSKKLNEPLIAAFEPRRTNFDWITSDEKIVDKYVEDPLCGYSYTPKFYKEFFKGILDVNKPDVVYETKDMPLLFIGGKNDPVGELGVGVRKIRELYSGHGLHDLSIKIVDDARHEVLNEKNKKDTYGYILDWIDKSIIKVKAELY